MTTLYVIAGIAIIPLIAGGIIAQNRVRDIFLKYSRKPTKKGIAGGRLARTMVNQAGLKDIVIEEVRPELGDHYDPRHKVIRLSRAVSRGSSISAVGIAAHEAAHAVQDGTGYAPVRLRNNIAPIVEKASYLILPFLFFGILLGGIIASAFFINLALFLFLGVVIFYLVTLPVELEASSRALRYIKDNKIADDRELKDIEEVLRAAALTYIIAALLAIAQFLRLLGMRKR